MNLEKLKDSARKFEQKEDWRKAIDVYLKAIQQIESGAETSPDLSLYNRVGDLYLKINDTAAAVRSYERAVDLYADQGFFNNAIALCGKILRVNPGRTQTYLKLAQLHARKNVVIEAKRNLIEFLERMNGLGQLDQAFQSVKEFADQFSGSQEIRMMLVELLRAASREEEALEQLAKIAGDLELAGGGPAHPVAPAGEGADAAALAPPRPPPRSRGDLVFLDTGLDVPTTPPAAAAPAEPPVSVDAPPPEGLELTQPDYTGVEEPAAAEALAGLEQTIEADTPTEPVGLVAGLELETPAADLSFEGLPLEPTVLPVDAEVDAAPVEGLLDTAEDLDLSLAATEVDFTETVAAVDDLDLDFIEDEAAAPSPSATTGLPLIEAERKRTRGRRTMRGRRRTRSRSSRTGSSTIRTTPISIASWRTDCCSWASCPAPRRSCGSRSKATSAPRTGRVRRGSRTASSPWSRTRSTIIRSGSSWPSGPVSGPRSWMPTSRWATRSAEQGRPTRPSPCIVACRSTTPPMSRASAAVTALTAPPAAPASTPAPPASRPAASMPAPPPAPPTPPPPAAVGTIRSWTSAR